ncbi:MAG: LOG family protein, partial [Alphaproteobacteria bacterium]
MKSICIYCGSSMGNDPRYNEAADLLGRLIGEAELELIYGGGKIGLMGTVADAVLKAGGRVTGIIPSNLKKVELAHDGLSEMIVVESMHERKRMMFDKSDAFVTLPGGPGTLDETI